MRAALRASAAYVVLGGRRDARVVASAADDSPASSDHHAGLIEWLTANSASAADAIVTSDEAPAIMALAIDAPLGQGFVCVTDVAPRAWPPAERALLRDCADTVEGLLSSEATHPADAAIEREFLGAVLENVGEGIVACDAEGRLTVFNRTTREFHGISISDIARGALAERYNLYHADGVTPLRPEEIPLLRAAAGEVVDKQEIVIAPKDRPLRHVLCSGRALRGADGSPMGAVIAMHDVTEEHRLVLELREALDAAERASQTKSEFLSRASHELRTPLNSVIGFANILRRNRSGSLTADELTYVDRIARNGKHLLALVNDLLDLSKIEAGHMTLELAPVSLFDVFHEVYDSLSARAQQFGLDFRLELPQVAANSDFTIITDEQRLRQVLINLVGNAVKYTPAGSVVLRLRATESGMPTRIEVEDTGPGIAAGRLVSIFDAFSTGDAVARGDGATGLGLTITKSLCTELGYTLEVKSVLGEGTTFSVVLRAM